MVVRYICEYSMLAISRAFISHTEWANNVLIWLCKDVHLMFIFSRTTKQLILRLKIKTKQSVMTRHDFARLQLNFNKPTCMFIVFLAFITHVCPSVGGKATSSVGVACVIIQNAHSSDPVHDAQQLTAFVPDAQPFTFRLDDLTFSAGAERVPSIATYAGGGTKIGVFTGDKLMPFAVHDTDVNCSGSYEFVKHSNTTILESVDLDQSIILCKILLSHMAMKLPRSTLLLLTRQHNISINTRTSKANMVKAFLATGTYLCNGCITVFRFNPEIA